MKKLNVLGLILFVLLSACNPTAELEEAAARDASGTDSGPDASAADASESDASDAQGPGPTDARDAADAADASDDVIFRITSPRSDRPVGYRLQVVAQPERVQDGSRFEAEQSDQITEETDGWLIRGETGTAPSSDEVHGDMFRWPQVDEPQYGITGWSADAPADDYTLTINGVEIAPDSLPALDPDPDPDPSEQADCLGGGECYEAILTTADADVVLDPSADLGALRAALANASHGDVIFIDPAAEIDLGFDADGPSIEVPAGVTLASNRGDNGSLGARLYGGKKPGSDWIGSDTIRVNDDVRITGLRIEGPDSDREMNWLDADHDYTDGIEAKATAGVEIDNNELYGWPAAAIHGGDPIHVHHNYIHDNDQSGLGYGVSACKWGSVIEYNQFRRNRHAVAGAGVEGDGYTLRYNVFGSEGIGGAGHKIDMHADPNSSSDGGTRMEIYRNTIKFANAQGVYLRATPRESAEIYENWFYNSTPPCLRKERGGSYCAIELKADDWTNVTYHDNHYGSSEPGCDIGGPRDGC